jgi:hypothetical protein
MYIVMYYICVGGRHTQRPILYYIYFNDMSIINIVFTATGERCKTATAGCRIRSYCGRRNSRGSDDMRVESAKILHANLYTCIILLCIGSSFACHPRALVCCRRRFRLYFICISIGILCRYAYVRKHRYLPIYLLL